MLKFILLFLLHIELIFGKPPHITGKVDVSIKNGTINAELILTGIPQNTGLGFLLNTGFNIEYMKDIDQNKLLDYSCDYKSERSFESFLFNTIENNNLVQMPNKFGIKYTGKFPVFNDSSNKSDWRDWKGNIAFNNKNFRASEQSVWYPIIYDKSNNVAFSKYTYDIEITCLDCESLYINGSEPFSGSSSKFSSNKEVDLFLFLGNYEFKKFDGISILNSDISDGNLETLVRITSDIKKYYQKKLNIPYNQTVSYINTRPISRMSEWIFVTFPSIVIIGIDHDNLDQFFDSKKNSFKDSSDIILLAHELGHYYFGNLIVPRGKYKWFFLEGVTEYISLKFIKEVISKDIYLKLLVIKKNKIDNFSHTSLDKLTTANQIDEIYRYDFIPLLLEAFEIEIGEELIWKWLKHTLTKEFDILNFVDLKKSFIDIGVGEKTVDDLFLKYIQLEISKTNILSKVIKSHK